MRKALAKLGYETVYLTAPVAVSTVDLPFDPLSLGGQKTGDGVENFRSWWPSNESAPEYYSVDASFEAIKQSVQENGPYDGVIGFSQGAGFGAVLCAAIHKLDQYTKPAGDSKNPGTPPAGEEYKQKDKPLKFGVFYSGFRAKPEYLQHWYEPPISVPSLHVLGSMDTVVSEERSMALYNACNPDTRILLTHPGGHFVPNSKSMVEAVVKFIQQVEEKAHDKVQPSAAEEKEEDWDAFDKIGKI